MNASPSLGVSPKTCISLYKQLLLSSVLIGKLFTTDTTLYTEIRIMKLIK